MKLERTMTLIVRGAGLICLVIATWQLLGLLWFLWEKHAALDGVGGYGTAFLPVGILSVSGLLLWFSSGRLGRWLCQEPVKRRRPRPVVQELLPVEEEGEEQ